MNVGIIVLVFCDDIIGGLSYSFLIMINIKKNVFVVFLGSLNFIRVYFEVFYNRRVRKRKKEKKKFVVMCV